MKKTDIEKYGNWYFIAHHKLKEKFGKDYELFCKILAATSPRKTVFANWNLAHKIFYSWKMGLKWNKGLLTAHKNNIKRAFNGESLSGPKVINFAKNLTGNWDSVTVDSWTARYFGYPDRLTRKQYESCTKRIKRIAQYHKVKPCQVQATAWCLALKQKGRSVKEFGYV